MEGGKVAFVCDAGLFKGFVAGAGGDVGVELAEVEVDEEVSVAVSSVCEMLSKGASLRKVAGSYVVYGLVA